MRILSSIRLTAAITLTAIACDNYAGVRVSSLTRTYLTDAPFPYDRIARVDLFIVSVSGSITGDTGTAATDFETLAAPNRRINVFALQNGLVEEIGARQFSLGTISAVRMVIDTDSSSITLKNGQVLTGKSTPGIAWQSSAGRPVLNAVIHDLITVPEEGGQVAIDFDVGRAFIPVQELDPSRTDSGFIFSPVFRAVDARRTGSLSGFVRAASEAGAPVVDASLRLYLGRPGDPESTWSMLGTAKPGGDGGFRFTFVTQSIFWAGFPANAGKTYIVTVDPPSGSSLGRRVVQNVSVSAGVETAMGIIVLP